MNYDGFDGSDRIFPDMVTVTEKIEEYIKERHGGRVDGALGSSLGGSFVGQLIMRRKVHGIFGSSDLDQSGVFAAKLQTKIMYPIIASAAKKNGKQGLMRKLMINTFLMSEETADKFMACFAQFKPESILNEYYTDLITCLDDDIQVPHGDFSLLFRCARVSSDESSCELHESHCKTHRRGALALFLPYCKTRCRYLSGPFPAHTRRIQLTGAAVHAAPALLLRIVKSIYNKGGGQESV